MKKFLKKCWKGLKKPAVWTFILLMLAGLVIWFGGPLLAIAERPVLQGAAARAVLIAALFVVWGITLGIRTWLKNRKERTEEEIQLALDMHQRKQKVREDSGLLSKRLDDAIATIKRSSLYGRRGDKVKYELPWYLVMGDQGSGKTSLLEHSGIDFPLNQKDQNRLTRDIGASQHCDWYFANHAVMVDVAGRFLTRPDPDLDYPVWEGFLKRLHNRRRRRPVNGVIMTLDVSRLLNESEQDIEKHGRLIREQMELLQKHLKISVPVYLVLTQADKLEGFNETFDSLTAEEREQVMGITFRDGEDGTSPDVIRKEYEELLRRLNAQMITRVNNERDIQRRTRVLQLPQTMASLSDRLAMFIELAFAATRYHKGSHLRGFYFTSSPTIQASVDSSTRAIGQNLGMNSGMLPVIGNHKGLFIRRLLEEVVIPEADLAGIDERHERQVRWNNRLVYGGAASLVVASGLFWSQSFVENTDQHEALAKYYNQYHEAQLTLSPLADARSLLPALNRLYDSTQVYNGQASIWSKDNLGLGQGGKVLPVVETAYEDELRTELLPRVLVQLEEQILANLDNRDFLFQALRAYLMLREQQHLDADYLGEWLALDWSYRYSGDGQAQQELGHHLQQLLASGFETASLDRQVIDKARHILRQEPLADLVYRSIREDGFGRELPDFTFASLLSPQYKVFAGADVVIPGLYTQKGYQQVFLPNGLNRVRSEVQENWVLGTSTQLSELEIRQLYSDIEDMYFKDYAQYWTDAVSALRIAEVDNLQAASVQVAGVLSGTEPVIRVLAEIRENTTFLDQSEQLQGVADAAAQVTTGTTRRLARLAAGGLPAALDQINDSTAKQAITRRFRSLHLLLPDGEDIAVSLQDMNAGMIGLHESLSTIVNGPDRGRGAYDFASEHLQGNNAAMSGLATISTSLPLPVRNWVDEIVGQVWVLSLEESRQHITEQYQNRIIAEYRRKFAGRYPFTDSQDEVRLAEFSSFFRKGGILDAFWDSVLSPFAVMYPDAVAEFNADGHSINLPESFWDGFIQARQIQEAFFDEEQIESSLNFSLEPYQLDSSVLNARFRTGGQRLDYQHGPVQSQRFHWPDRNNAPVASVELRNVAGVNVPVHEFSGDWALFRLVEQFDVNTYGDGSVLKLDLGDNNGMNVQYLLRPGASVNPFTGRLLKDFELSELL